MKMRNGIPAVLICLLITACEEPIHAPLSSVDTDRVVVEGMLTSENTNHLIKLSRPYKTQNENPVPITGAVVTITEGSNVYPLTESPVGSGDYFTPPVRAVVGKTYSLLIQYQGNAYSAQDSPIAVETLHPLKYQKNKDLYTLTLNPSGQAPNFIRHTLSWANTGACTSGADCKGEVVYYDLKTIDVNEIYKPGKADFNFPLNTVVIRTKYSVSPSYKAFLRAMLSETEWRGGVFDVQRADVPTNLSGGAIGFFAVSTVVSDTTVIAE